MIEVWSNGGGTQSAAIAALIVQGRLPKPDIAVIADTGFEMPTTWEYLEEITRPALKSVGVEIHRVSKADFASPRGRELFATSGHLMIPAYSTITGEVSKLSGFCSSAWKVEVVSRWLSSQGHKPRTIRRWIGYSLDETRRWKRMEKGDDYKAGRIRFPLVYDVPLRRQAAIDLVRRMGWPQPPRSRCWMCPNQSDLEWREVERDHHHLFEKAKGMDNGIREKDPAAWLHGSCVPLAEADISAEDDLFSAGCTTGECYV